VVITDRNGTIEWVNPAWTALTGFSLEEAIGQNPRLLKSGVQDRAFYQNLWDTILAGRVWRRNW
jgi:PAS domain S-box-containing protein